MKKTILCLILLIVPLYLFSCSPEQKTQEGAVVATINGCPLTLSECQRQLAVVVDLREDYKLTKEAKREFLEELIRKELLIQEAKRLELDRTEKFIRAIERYWEATLIKNLMEIKGVELTERTLVSQDEIEARYNDMKKQGELQPLESLREKIVEEIREKKKTEMLGKWIEDLRKTAQVEINEKLLYE